MSATLERRPSRSRASCFRFLSAPMRHVVRIALVTMLLFGLTGKISLSVFLRSLRKRRIARPRLSRARRLGRSPPPPKKTYESNLIHHDFLQFEKQHSRCKAILPSIVLSQKCCEIYVISLAVAKPLCYLATKYRVTEIAFPSNFVGETHP